MATKTTKDSEKTYLGHRSRARSLILEAGIEKLPPYQILEYILFHAIPRKDTKHIAYELLDKFGTFADVLLADVNELVAVKDMTENAALLLHSLPAIFSVYQKTKLEAKTTFTSHTALPFIKTLFDHDTEECLYLLCFDAKKQLLHVDKISDGTSQSVSVSIKKIAECTLQHRACFVLLAHNHPSDNVYPSVADRETTANILHLLNSMGIKVIDHVIVGSNHVFSFARQTRLDIQDGSYPINNTTL